MKKYEYEITTHPAEEFSQVNYFCTAGGDCAINEVPEDQIAHLSDLLNQRGNEGWELVHMAFGNGGVLAFWKKPILE